MKIVMLLMLVAPIGIFGLVAGRFGRAGDMGELIGGVGWYMATVLLALGVHALVVLPAVLWFVGRRNPWRYMFNMGTALLTAFSTASSSATLPLTMEGVEKHNGVSEKVAGFVVPLGATVNMNGTAMYEAVAAHVHRPGGRPGSHVSASRSWCCSPQRLPRSVRPEFPKRGW